MPATPLPHKHGWIVAALICACVLVICFAGRSANHMGERVYGAEAPSGSTDAELWGGQTPSAVFAGSRTLGGDLIDAGTEILERYEETQGCELVYAGYLDLFGNVWACLVAGPGWAELSVVHADQTGAAQTSVAHIDTPLLETLGGDTP